MSEEELPEGWAEAEIGTVLELRYGKGLPGENRRVGRVPVYGSNGIVGTHDDAVTTAATIIVGRKGSVGEVHFSPVPCWPIDTTYFIDDGGPYELPFLCHLLRSLDLRQHESSTAIPGLSRDDVYARDIIVPPLAEQRRIVEKVEAVLAQVNATRARLAKVPTILKRCRQSILSAACSGRLTEKLQPSTGDWASGTVDSACDDIVDCPHSTPKWSSAGHICLRTTNFTPRGLDLSEVRHVDRQTYLARMQRLRPRPGDVVYSREGGILGIACVLPDGLEACLGQRMMLMRPNPARMVARFLETVLNSPETLAKVRELTGGTASPHLNVADIKAFEVPLPSISEQHEIVRRVEALFKLADGIEARVGVATARADKLTQAVLAKAFRGELVPTEAELARQEGRDYEPASALLAHIRAARATSEATAKPTTRARRADAGATPTGKPAHPNPRSSQRLSPRRAPGRPLPRRTHT